MPHPALASPGLVLQRVTPPMRLTDFKLIAFDMDSTLINIECVDEIADAVGRKAEVAAITEAAMRGEIADYKDSLRQRVALLKGVSVDSMAQVFTERLRLNPGAAELVAACKQAGLKVLLVSGGHTMLVLMEGHGRYRMLGSTLDDAAGEAFDKVARYLGLGYPGGPAIDAEAMGGDPTAIAFPRARMAEGYDFSFSGLKTSVVNHVRRNPQVSTADVSASFQQAVVDVLVTKARRAAAEHGAKGLVLAGGVAANSQLRESVLDACMADGLHPMLPSRSMCTDNAAMVAAAAWWRLKQDGPSPLDTGANASLRLPVM